MATLEEIGNLVIEKIRDEWTLAGHSLSGNFEESLEAEIVNTEQSTTINIWGNEYGIYQSEGVSAENIPYTRRKRGEGQGGTSKYMTGLIQYAQTRLGIGDINEAMSVAFAIAENHSQNGMLGSGFLDEVRTNHEQEIDLQVSQYLDNEIEKNM